MIRPDQLMFSYKWAAETFEKLVSDVPDQDFAKQPVATINHPAWLFGHIDIYSKVIVALLQGEEFANPWDEPCGKNSVPTEDRSQYPSKEEILARHRQGFEAASKAISEATPEQWAASFSHPAWGKQFGSVAEAVVFLATTHQSLHLGQLSGWRRAMDLPRI